MCVCWAFAIHSAGDMLKMFGRKVVEKMTNQLWTCLKAEQENHLMRMAGIIQLLPLCMFNSSQVLAVSITRPPYGFEICTKLTLNDNIKL